MQTITLAADHHEAAGEADALAVRIKELDHLLSVTKDSGQAAALRAQLIELQAQWEAAIARRERLASGIPQPPKTNGDIDALKANLVALGKAVASDKPEEAHAIITGAIEALTRMDARLGHVEARVTALERHVNPPLAVRIWQMAALFVVLFGGSLFWVKDSRDLLFGLVPIAGILLEGVLVLLALACLLLASAKLREYAR